MSAPAPSGGGARRSAAWSGGYLIVSGVSVVVSVPILLHGLGTDLYAVWVLASTLVFSQGLVDLGFSAALVRFVAVGAAQGSGTAVRSLVGRVSLVYAGLSLLGLVLWLVAGPLARALPYVHAGQVADAVTLLRYTAVAFALTNATTVFSAALQGLGCVAQAFRAQTLGAALFVPLLVFGMSTIDTINAVGIAAVGSYAVQVLLLGPCLWTALRRLPRQAGAAASLREMLAVGLRWQVSTWADFATFQLPRIAAGLALSSRAVVLIDLALRFSQAIATPLFALLPMVLPRASARWAAQGIEGVREFLRPLLQLGVPFYLLFAAVAVPLAPSSIETWTGHALSLPESIATCGVAAGVLAHASTGALSSVLLAVGQIGAVVRYKSAQLALAVPLVGAGALVGSNGLAGGLTLALLVPALWFNNHASRAVGLRMAPTLRLYVGAVAVMAVTAVIVSLMTLLAAAAIAVPAAGVAGLLAAAGVLRFLDLDLSQSLLPGLSRKLRTSH